eukprot:TRINITY_DN72141_c0_g1_i1.p1 TRINITY_DN72141_c0_g1~~TRINITY_DN72141_c0_g1_i1.p1  ORF type:complete len:369 (+),score=63.57 TRINITY_DN72141_c0_g1_i1:86-1192(+)
MESYSRSYGSASQGNFQARSRSPTRSTSPRRASSRGKLPGETISNCLERLDNQVNTLNIQVLKAVRVVGTVQDVLRDVDRRLTSLESTGFVSQSPRSVASPRHSAQLAGPLCDGLEDQATFLNSVDQRLKGRFRELQEWQADVQEAVRQLISEANREASQAILKSNDALEVEQLDSKKQQRALEFGKCTEATISKLEEDLAMLRQDLKKSSAAASILSSVSPRGSDGAANAVRGDGSGGYSFGVGAGATATATESFTKLEQSASTGNKARNQAHRYRSASVSGSGSNTAGRTRKQWDITEERASLDRLYEELLNAGRGYGNARRAPQEAHLDKDKAYGLGSGRRQRPGSARRTTSATGSSGVGRLRRN